MFHVDRCNDKQRGKYTPAHGVVAGSNFVENNQLTDIRIIVARLCENNRGLV